MLRQGFAALAAALAFAAPAAANETVTVAGNHFTPGTVTIQTGEKVTWTNPDHGFHNVKFEDGQFEVPASASPDWPADVSRTFTTAGTYDYFCELHKNDGMTGEVVVEDPPSGTDYEFVGASGGAWETASNWTPAGVPGTNPADTAKIAAAKTVLMGGDHAIARLDMSADGAITTGDKTLTLTGGGTWTSARLSGRVVVNAGAVLSWSGGYLFNGELENLGKLTIGDVIFGNGSAGSDDALLDNQNLLEVTADVTDASAGGARIQNPGTLRGKATAVLAPALSNPGKVVADAGVLDLTGGSLNPNPGDYEAAAGATLRFSGATTTGQAGAQITGAGTVDIPFIVDMSAADPFTVANLIVGGVLFAGSGSVTTLDLDGSMAVYGTFNVAGVAGTWSTPAAGGAGTLRVGGNVTLASMQVRDSVRLQMDGPTVLESVAFGNGDLVADAAPELILKGATTLAPGAAFTDATAGGAPKLTIGDGGTLTLGTQPITLPAAFATAGTLATTLAGAADFGKLTVGGAVTLGGALAVDGAFKPAEGLRVIQSSAPPAGTFATVTSGFEAIKDATGVLVRTKVEPEPTASPTPSPTATAAPSATAAPQPSPTPTPTVVPAPAFGSLVKLPKCASKRSVRVRLVAPARTVKAALGKRTLKRSAKTFTLRRLPKKAFTLKFEVTLPDGRTVSGSKRFKPCKGS